MPAEAEADHRRRAAEAVEDGAGVGGDLVAVERREQPEAPLAAFGGLREVDAVAVAVVEVGRDGGVAEAGDPVADRPDVAGEPEQLEADEHDSGRGGAGRPGEVGAHRLAVDGDRDPLAAHGSPRRRSDGR